MRKVRLSGHAAFSGMEDKRPATVRVQTRSGSVLEQHVPAVRGTADNPMTRAEIEDKAADLIGSVYGPERAGQAVRLVMSLEQVASMRELRPLVTEA
jgi:2-methylcitrate dehydratase PrpD